MVNADSEAVGRFGAQTQLDPVSGVVRVDAADFDAPFASRRFEFGTVEVDKKLVRVGNSRRDGPNEADFSSHADELCKFSASMRHAFRAGLSRLSFNAASERMEELVRILRAAG
jgi:hypothetical protein